MTAGTFAFWDWNGTLLDDVEYCVSVINRTLSRRGMPTIAEPEYLRLFRFPAIEYYRELGFDFDDAGYAELASEFNADYVEHMDRPRLRAHAEDALKRFRDAGIEQYIVTASERSVMVRALEARGMAEYFAGLICNDDFLAEGKAARASEFAKTLPEPARKILIGDTAHDLETAEAIGAECVLVAGGHAHIDNLKRLNARIILDLRELYPLCLGA